jgi:hypothetical protein
MDTDASSNSYIEIEIPGGKVRITYIQNGWADTPSVRIQIRDATGHLRQGPEIPIASIGEVVGAVVNLLSTRHPS